MNRASSSRISSDVPRRSGKIWRARIWPNIEAIGCCVWQRQFEIIGEAVSRLLKDEAALAARITDYRRIIDFRNAISHGYDVINDQLVWDVVTKELPRLVRDVQVLLTQLSE